MKKILLYQMPPYASGCRDYSVDRCCGTMCGLQYGECCWLSCRHTALTARWYVAKTYRRRLYTMGREPRLRRKHRLRRKQIAEKSV